MCCIVASIYLYRSLSSRCVSRTAWMASNQSCIAKQTNEKSKMFQPDFHINKMFCKIKLTVSFSSLSDIVVCISTTDAWILSHKNLYGSATVSWIARMLPWRNCCRLGLGHRFSFLRRTKRTQISVSLHRPVWDRRRTEFRQEFWHAGFSLSQIVTGVCIRWRIFLRFLSKLKGME